MLWMSMNVVKGAGYEMKLSEKQGGMRGGEDVVCM
jgi:hypothetical protein